MAANKEFCWNLLATQESGGWWGVLGEEKWKGQDLSQLLSALSYPLTYLFLKVLLLIFGIHYGFKFQSTYRIFVVYVETVVLFNIRLMF